MKRVRRPVFGHDESNLRSRVQLNWVFLLVVVIVLTVIKSKIRFPENVWTTLVRKRDYAMDVVDDLIAKLESQLTGVETTGQVKCNLV